MTKLAALLIMILAVADVLANGQNAQPRRRGGDSVPPVAREWLRHHARTVLMLDRINLAHVKGLKDCACHEQYKSRERLSPQCDPRQAAVEPEFVRTIVNFYGETRQLAAVSCATILQRLVFSRLESDWPDLRRAMALMRPAKIHNATVAEIFDNGFGERPEPIPHLEYKINPRPEHLIRGLPWNDDVKVKPQAPLTAAETKTYMAEYTEFSAQACQREFAERSCKANQPAIFYDRTPVVNKCNKIIYGRDGAALAMRAAFGDSVKAMNDHRWRTFHKEHQDRYAELVQTNPILVMVSAPRPKFGELIAALHTIQGNALARYEDVRRDLAQTRDLEKYAGRYHVLGYSESIWSGSGKSEADFAHWRAVYVKKYTERQQREALIEVGALVGITVACVVPWGRTLAPAMAMMKVGCLAGLGIPLNAFFLIDSIRGYDRDFRNFFSSVEFSQAFFENGLDRLEGDRADLVLNALFLPLGLTQLAPRAMSRAYRQALGRP